jgi:3-oxoadipate enol-lactonase/4-carboxymuconolactone decarboxylase
MPFVQNAGARLYWREDGAADRPAILLLHPVGCDHALFNGAVELLIEHARVLRMDVRGHGASDAPAPPYLLSTLADDARAVLDAAGAENALVCGVSLGGMIAMELALAAPARVGALVLACTSADMDRSVWRERIAAVEHGGMAAVADAAMQRYFREGFAALRPERAGAVRATLLSTNPAGYAGAAAAISTMQLAGRLSGITAPTAIITGRHDVATPLAPHGQALLTGIVGSGHAELNTAHLPPVEAPRAFAALIVAHLKKMQSAASVRAAGEIRRRAVLGDAWVDTAKAKATQFTAPFQDYIERAVWGDIWRRLGMTSDMRRIIAIAITAALGRSEEMGLHVQAALTQHALTQEDIQETLLQVGVYAGVPAANSAFAEAASRIAEIDTEREQGA